MRRSLRRRLFLSLLGLAILALVLVQVDFGLFSQQLGIDVQDARRVITYELPQGEGEWLRFPIPVALPDGYHEVRLTLRSGRHTRSAEQRLIVSPTHCPRAGPLSNSTTVCHSRSTS